MNKNYSVSFYTLGCKVNQYETQSISEQFSALGFKINDFSEKSDVYVINTCTVTSESDRKSRQIIRRAVKNGGKDAIVIVIGCFSQANPSSVSQIEGVSLVLGNDKKSSVAQSAIKMLENKSAHEQKVDVGDIGAFKDYEDLSITHSERTRAVVKIVDGCENRCAYCIIPSVRGKIRSRKRDEILKELEILSSAGYKEIVFTGIETAAYGKDLENYSLCSLLEDADKIPGIERIRLSSLEPTCITPDFAQRVSRLKHVVPHFHLSLQSGSTRVLNMMRRKYTAQSFYEKVLLLRSLIKDVTFTTDIIVGFPGENDEMFEETADFVRKCGFLYVHIFPYSVRKGTAAEKFPCQVPENIKHLRAAKLKKVMLETRKQVLLSFDGKKSAVIFEEKSEDGYVFGHTANFIEVRAKKDFNFSKSDIFSCVLHYNENSADFMDCEILK